MAFDWMEPHIPPDITASFAAKHRHMYEREIAERAALLLRLGYPRDEVVARIRGNIAWEFELTKTPDFLKSVPGIVDKVRR